MRRVIRQAPPAAVAAALTEWTRTDAGRRRRGGPGGEASGQPPGVLDALKLTFDGVCAYCEGPVADGPWAIDTFRPRSLYPWLAHTWENVYLCCRACNSAKAGAFPVDGPRAAAGTPGARIAGAEAALLIDPCGEDPRQHIDIEPDGELGALSPRGRVTIGVLQLNRAALVAGRAAAMREVEDRLAAIDAMLPGDPFAQRLLDASQPERLSMLDLDAGRPYLSARLVAAAAWAARVGDRPWLPNLSGYLRRSPAVVATHPLAAGHPPRWACGWGHDKYGPYADLAVGRVKQRFRWCPPGKFMMGSPEGEAGRWDELEGQPHEVTLSQGYWMADSPVTQALWLAVMGENPSEFADPAHLDRPLESVDWIQAARFCALLEERLQRAGLADDGLCFRLPTEAEWEYACRAGTTTATYAGDLTLRGENDAPELDAIAWFGGNSGVDYDLAGGTDSSGWPKKQHPHSKAGSRVVKQKAPNAWGLYDTLGNVWEWCADAVEYGKGYPGRPRVHPLGQAGPSRANRGGSWADGARYVRAACRVAFVPSIRSHDLGLRLSRGRAHQTSPVKSPESE